MSGALLQLHMHNVHISDSDKVVIMDSAFFITCFVLEYLYILSSEVYKTHSFLLNS